MASLSELENRLSSKRSRRDTVERLKDEAETLRDRAKNRRDAVKKLNKALKSSFDNEARAVTKNVKRVDSNLEKGIYAGSVASDNSDVMANDHEKDPESDARLGSAISYLDSEESALDTFYDEKKRAIRDYSNEISGLNWDITCLKAEIAAEKDRQRRQEIADSIANIFS